jgi:hypothetical protein
MFGLLTKLVIAFGLGFTVYTIANGVAGGGDRRGAPPFLRGLMLIWLAISLATLVLVWLSGFERSDWIILIVVFGILAALAALDRGMAHRRGAQS